MAKQRIRLTESQLHNIIRKCVNEAVNEIGDKHPGGELGFADHVMGKMKSQGRQSQANNVANLTSDKFEKDYNLSTYMDGMGEVHIKHNIGDFYHPVNDTEYIGVPRRGNGSSEKDIENFRKNINNSYKAKQRNQINRGIDKFKQYADYKRRQRGNENYDKFAEYNN